MQRFLLLFILSPFLAFGQPHTSFYVSPTGDDSHSGTIPNSPFATISHAFQIAQPGDTINLLSGTYLGRSVLTNIHGQANLPIILRSLSDNPLEFAVIDGQGIPSLTAQSEGFLIQDCSWLHLENLIFKDCWVSVIYLLRSSYISIRGCHFSTGKRVIHAVGNQTHHVLVENCYIKHPSEVWQGWSWESLHHGDYSYYNGALLHPNQSGGGHIMRGNTLINLYNAFRTRPTNIKEDGNTEVYNNTLSFSSCRISTGNRDLFRHGSSWQADVFREVFCGVGGIVLLRLLRCVLKPQW